MGVVMGVANDDVVMYRILFVGVVVSVANLLVAEMVQLHPGFDCFCLSLSSHLNHLSLGCLKRK